MNNNDNNNFNNQPDGFMNTNNTLNQPNNESNNGASFGQPSNVSNNNIFNQTNNNGLFGQVNANGPANQQNNTPFDQISNASNNNANNNIQNTNASFGQSNNQSNMNVTPNQAPVINMNYSSGNQNFENPKKNGKLFKIIGIAVAVIVVFIFVIKLFGGGSSGGGFSSGKTVEQGQALNVKTKYTDMVITVNSVEKGVTRGSSFGSKGTFDKISLTIKNNSEKKGDLSSINNVTLLDANGNKLTASDVDGKCYGNTWGAMYGITDALDEFNIPANQTTTGFLYCLDEKGVGSKLEISTITGIDEEALKQGQVKSTGSVEYYVNLK